MGRRFIRTTAAAAALILTGGVGVAVAGPAAAADGPLLTGLSFPTATQDVTYKAGSVTLTATARNTDQITVSFEVVRDPSAPVGPVGTDTLMLPAMQRTAGTAADGTYSLTVPLTGGTRSTWRFSLVLTHVVDGDNAVSEVWPTSRLVGAGLPSQVSTSTAPGVVPPAPRGLSVRSEWFVGGELSAYQRWRATWSQSATGRPVAADWVTTSTGKCRPTTGDVWWSVTAFGVHQGGTGTCTITVRARNANGTSAAVTGSTFFIG
ncbi:hypothetical protein ACIB24_16870 [Spongisporangium articulatum]|uniref:Uncharacterized protein n=1 Tax=Spongisporangium articulatum TaxID=3362603 RepID=A0ABW8AQV6_9ACTN